MATPASAIVNRVRNQLIDVGVYAPVRWTDAEMFMWIGDAQRAIIAAIPRASTKTASFAMVAGTRQAIPADGYMLLRINRNMGVSGTTPGNALRKVERETLDDQQPDWHTQAQVAAPVAYTFDVSDPKAFYVYPPADGTAQVEGTYSAKGEDPTALTDVLQVEGLYLTPVFNYVMASACAKDSDYAPGQAVYKQYMDTFTAFLEGAGKDGPTLAAQAGKG